MVETQRGIVTETQRGTGGIQESTWDRCQTGINVGQGGSGAYFASNRNRDPKHNTGVDLQTWLQTGIETRNTTGGIKTGEKRQESYKKSPGNVPGGGRGWIKRRGDKSHRKRVVGNEKTGSSQRRGCQRRGCQRRQGSCQGK
ncbi:hypothetical protein TNCV_4882841 [Trichonephila clavipes]|nr:hypothetical protein TNCV_4882841 [Trichonephila clavipes]